jgi:hypothetical protein
MPNTLFLKSITQINSNVLELEFSKMPLSVSSTGPNDALNILNYSILGPLSNTIDSVVTVSGNPFKFRINVKNGINSGEWTLRATNIQTSTGIELSTPTSLSFTVQNINTLTPVGLGATSQTPEDIIKAELGPALKGKNWNAFATAVGWGDTLLQELGQRAFNQLFLSTASGKYLDRKASDNGFNRPVNVGISDDVFRKLAIKVSAEKVTLQSFLQVLETFYGVDALHATSDSIAETFSLEDEDDLILEIDGRRSTIVFHQDDFTDINSIKSIEIASIINLFFRNLKTNAFAIPVKDHVLGVNFVRIYSGALGLRGSVRVLGGKAQNKLQFPSLINTTQSVGTTWQIDNSTSLPTLGANKARISFTIGTSPSLQLVRIGDIANIYGAPFNSANRGAFEITDVTTTYFEIINLNATVQGSVVQIDSNDILFFRPVLKTINNNLRTSYAAQGNTSYTDVFLAATTQAVNRAPFSASYLHLNDGIALNSTVSTSDATDLSRTSNVVTVTTSEDHGLFAGQLIYMVPSEPYFESGVKTVTSITNATTFTYSEVGIDATSTLSHDIYVNFRDANGLVTLTTDSEHNLATGQNIILDNVGPANDTSFTPFFELTDTGTLTAYDYTFATSLSDGVAFVCGGQDNGFPAVSHTDTYLFDEINNNTWTSGAFLNNARAKHDGVLLNNGRVMVCGGIDVIPLASTEIYDPTNDVWIISGEMNVARVAHSVALLNNGKVLTTGGGSLTAETYDSNTGQWTAVASASVDRSFYTLTKLGDGRVLAAGGFDGANSLNTAEIYNPINDTWTTTPTMNYVRYGHRAIFLPELGTSGKVMVTGGLDDLGDPNNIVLIAPIQYPFLPRSTL